MGSTVESFESTFALSYILVKTHGLIIPDKLLRTYQAVFCEIQCQRNSNNTKSNMTSVIPDAFERIKNLIAKRDEVKIDNLLFQLHHQVNFIVLLVGFAFTFAENYIDGDAITCFGQGVNDYTTKFCFIHGSTYIKDSIQTELTGRKCRMRLAGSQPEPEPSDCLLHVAPIDPNRLHGCHQNAKNVLEEMS